MSIDMEFVGLNDLIKEAEKLASGVELEKVSEKILKQQAKKAHEKIKSKIPRSKDNSKSGLRGNSPGGHWVDNIPVSGLKKKGPYSYIIIGTQTDNTPYLYAKFIEWGTSSTTPIPAFSIVKEEIGKELEDIAMAEYKKLIESKLGG